LVFYQVSICRESEFGQCRSCGLRKAASGANSEGQLTAILSRARVLNFAGVIEYEDRFIETYAYNPCRQWSKNDVEAYIQAYNEAVFETDKQAALNVVNKALSEGLSPEDVVFKLVIPAIEAMMSRIEKDPDSNLAQHFMTAQLPPK